MRRHRIGWFLALALIVSVAAEASGTYRGGPPRAPGSVDREAYDVGKRLFAGTVAPAGDGSAAEGQRELLAAWQGRLPARVREVKDLPSLAGQLSDEQLRQLGYFLQVRYKIPTEGK